MTAVLSGEETPAPSSSPGGTAVPSDGRRRRSLLPLALLLPCVAALGVGLGYPLVRLGVTSMQEFGLPQQFGAAAPFVWFDNYSNILGDSYFWEVLRRSLLFCAVTVTLTIVLGTLAALLLERLGPRMRTATSVALLFAWATPALTATVVWQWIFDPRYGVVNWALTKLGADFEGHSWLSSPISFFFVATVVVVWMGVPFVAFTLYAGMTQISRDVVEAARIDGANAWERFRDVTWPSLKAIYVVLIALSTVWNLRVFTQIFVLQEAGGITRETNVIGVWAFRQSTNDYGAGAAVAIVMVVITLLFTVVHVRHMFRHDEV